MSQHLFDRLNSMLPDGVECRVLVAADALQLAELREEVVSRQLEDPNCYRFAAESPDFPACHLGEDGPGVKGLVVGIFDGNGRIVAYGALSFPGPGESHRGDVLRLPADEKDQVAYLASAMVRMEWRRKGLHHALIEIRMALAAEHGRRHAFSAAWPGNHVSWGHLTAHGFCGKALVHVAGGMLRMVLHRDMNGVRYFPDRSAMRVVAIGDLDAQGGLFEQGYWLWRRQISNDEISAELAPPVLMDTE